MAASNGDLWRHGADGPCQLAMPWFAPQGAFWANGLYEAVAILFVFPCIVLAGAGSSLSGVAESLLCKFLGDISYPLYATHYPLIYVQMSWAAVHPDAPAATSAAIGVSPFIIAIAVAYAALKLYDLPVRKWLARGLKNERNMSMRPKIDHIALYVNDLERARNFFVEMLGGTANDGYHNPRTDFRSYFISFGNGTRIEIMNKPGMVDSEKDLSRTGYAHIAFSLGSRELVDELTKRMESAGYTVVSGPRTTGDGCYESCIVAVEGNQIELTI